MRRLKSNVIFLLAGILLAACQSADTATQPASPERSRQPIVLEGVKPDCFYTREVTNWDSLNQVNLLVYAPNRNRAFLVEISPPAVSLRSSSNIAFMSGSDRICGRAGDKMRVGLDRGREFAVLDVRRVPAETVDMLLENRRSGEGDAPVKPAEVPGAEVERDVTPHSDSPAD
jgi:hypothetical protein